ncbi:MAG: hypothetical protein EBX08_05110 [Proteobacteria bacterium]|nr:hypothetical protein [Pseudomonadota bacterium]
MSINMNILNIFKKKPSEPEASKIETLLPEQHYVKISLEVEYLLGKQLYIYTSNYVVTCENEQMFNEGKEKQALNHINEKFTKIKNPNIKFVFEMGDFNKNLKEYESAIKYYTTVMESLDPNSDVMSDLLYRRGGSYERLGDYVSSDQDLLEALKINPDDAYTLNYLAYSWLERNFKISEAIEMLERAYASKRNDPYIIDSIGWAYYLTDDYSKAEPLLREAVELMPDDPTVNDHYGDVLWKLDRKIQARYFWNSVLNFEDTDADMKKKISIKLSQGMSNS